MTIVSTEKSNKEDQRGKTISKLPGPSQISRPRIVIGIPAYNEGRSISEVVRKAKKFTDKIIVVDDGSTDNTSPVAEAAGGIVIRHRVRMGAGAATKSCFNTARALGADVLVTMDGDNQHDPDELLALVNAIIRDKKDLAIGSRFMDGQNSVPAYRRFGIAVITWLFNVGSRVKISDSQSCYRAFGKKAINSLNITENGFAFSIEMLVEARQKGLTITEVPISCTYDSYSHSINPIIHGLGVALILVKIRLRDLLRRSVDGNGA